jgi:enoyl-[acyl-carrier-protein] reductase (NADH)
MKIPVEKDTLVRDTNTGAILETDVSKLEKHRAMQAAIREKENKIDVLIEKINRLETIIDGITHGKYTL